MKKGSRRIYKDGIYKVAQSQELQVYLNKGWILKGRPKTNEHRRKLSESHKRKHPPKPIKEDSSPKVSKLKGSIAINKDGKIKYINPKDLDKYLTKGWNKGNPIIAKANSEREITEDYRKHLSEGSKYENLSDSAKKHYKGSHLGMKMPPYSEQGRANMSKSSIRRVIRGGKKYQSDPEVKIAKYLSNYFEVRQQFQIPNSGYLHPYDMLVSLPGIELLIEFDGDYYHSPKCRYYDSVADAEREIQAKKHNYEFLVIKESDYWNNQELKFVKSRISDYYPEFADMHLTDKDR